VITRPTRPIIHLGTTRVYSWQEIAEQAFIAICCFLFVAGFFASLFSLAAWVRR
jgi:hypothetical protein